jgi:hypothetical protein
MMLSRAERTLVIPSVESRDLGGWGAKHVPYTPPTQVPRSTLGMTSGRSPQWRNGNAYRA